ncbi:2-dehydro-3-deoxygalactonokinase [Variovorax boronicumulans]|uniref:2-dehydro-3-deoxygalactonokinase n=1 Tax=Variovorax boronicumulans TaxID=436515 RepID=UPI0027800615|nr:2-dehydro-3-deoxygalactonokinase [Variovorax boronicumulans]MDQ0037752.1 2-dehydro-3-deoxygalactonokinase [Variovorax boronicumulans]
MTRLVAIDWGTSSLRGALLDADGKVIEERSDARGILKVPEGGFPAVFEALFGDWMRLEGAQCLISGMAGSKQGWVEAPYCACPAGRVEVGRKIIRIDAIPGARIAIVPGLSDEHDGVPDVMRGEEVQIFGAMALTGASDGLFVLPGTHNKWATVRKGRVAGFRTCMTGEFYALLSQHSILARTLDPAAPLDEAAFLQGVTQSENGHGLLHNAFGARTLALFERMPKEELSSYLSGLLIGEELRTQSLQAVGEVVLIGSPVLTERYTLALRAAGVATRTLGAEATWAGLHALSGFLAAADSNGIQP